MDEPGVRFEICAVAHEHVKRRVALSDLGAGHHLVRDTGPLRRLDGGAEEVRVLVIGRARTFAGNDQRAVLDEQRGPRVRFKLAPNLMRTARELRVFGAFAASEAGDARFTMTRSHAM